MGCACEKRRDDDHREETFKLLEEADLRGIAEQAVAIPEATNRAVRHLEKAERAERLSLGNDVAALYRQAADRDRAQGIRNYRAVLARIDERTGRADWRELADRTRQAFEERDGTALVDEARGRMRLAALDMDGVSADDAEAAVAIFDESLDRLVADGLDGAVSLLRERLERGLSTLESPTMGRQLASPITQNQTICIGIVSGVAVIEAIICAATEFCWCCWGWVIIAQLAIGILICLAS